jgi:hypothetical protein
MNDFNVLTMNGKCFPGTDPLVVRRGDRVRHPLRQPVGRWTTTRSTCTVTMLEGRRHRRRRGPALEPRPRRPRCSCPSGSTRDVEFVADAPGDWAMHCHMTHHVMNQMGHGFPNMTGADAAAIDARMAAAGVPGYMTMGHDGMGAMTTMGMPVPENSIPMTGGPGPYGSIGAGCSHPRCSRSTWAGCSPSSSRCGCCS